MEIIKDIALMRTRCRERKLKGDKIGFVPTMGALHKGHLSLIKRAREDCDFTVVSIFVNPTQFGPEEDFKRYPRNLSEDLRLCEEEGVDVVFAPLKESMYPDGFSTWVEVKGVLTETLEGTFRPGHFKGVTTVLTKLFNIVLPDYSYFGEKDYQQAMVVKKMVQELNIDTEIILLPTVREEDGLACSSRNSYLSPEERKKAAVLYNSLLKVKQEVERGEEDPSIITSLIRHLIEKEGSFKIDYVAVVNPDTLEPVDRIRGKTLITIAAWIGKTRLIDNILI